MRLSIGDIFRRPEKILPGNTLQTISGQTVRQTVDEFYESSDFRCGRPKTRSQKRYELEAFCKTPRKLGGTYGDLPIRGLTYRDIDAIIVEKLDKPGACKALIKVLRGLFRFAIKMGYVTSDPTFGIVLPSQNPNGIRTWTEAEIAIFEAAWPIGTMERLVFTMALYTALRRQDLLVLGPQHIRNGAICICPEKTRMTTGVFLVIPIHPELAKVLAVVPEGRKTFLRRKFGTVISPEHLTTWFINACRAAGLPKGLSLHGLRKAACRRLAESGCTVHEIMAVSGHRTMYQVQRYTMSVSWEKLARRAMGNLVRAFPAHAA
jgi:integrase